jgi:putative flippase GtrA
MRPKGETLRQKTEFRMRDQSQVVLRQFVSFAGVGVIATTVHYCFLVALISGLDSNPVIATAFGYIAGALISYWINYTVTFRSVRRHQEALVRFGTVAVIGLLLNTAVLNFGIDKFQLHYLAAQVTATMVVLVWNFVANKAWTF